MMESGEEDFNRKHVRYDDALKDNQNYRSTINIIAATDAQSTTSSSSNLENGVVSYDPHRFGNTKNPTTFWGTVFHLYMISAGPALLSIPIGFMKIGYIPGLAITFLVFLLYWYTMRMVCWSEYALCKLKQRPRMTYPEILYHGFDEGPKRLRWFAPCASAIIKILYIITWIGSLNIVLMSENLQVVYRNVYQQDVDTKTVMLFTFVPLLLLTWVHRLKYLVPLSMFGNAILVVCVLFVLYHVFFDPSPLMWPPAFGSVAAIPMYLGAVLFNLNATGLMMPLKNEMRKPKYFNSTFGVLTVSYFPMAFWYAIFNVFCCMRYGNDLRISVIENLPSGDPISQVIILLYSAALAFQQPLITYVVFDTIWNNMMKEARKTMTHLTFWEYTLRTLVYVVSFSAAYLVPNINVFLSISGTIGTAVDSMIFPCVMETLVEIRTHAGNVRCWVILKNMFIFLLAILVLIAGLATCVEEVSNTLSNPHQQ